MRVEIYHVEATEGMRIISPSIIHRGYLEVDSFDAEYCWHLCNWSCWTEEKPKNVHTDIEYCNHGIIFIDPETKECWLALSVGWLTGDSLLKISDYVRTHWEENWWE